MTYSSLRVYRLWIGAIVLMAASMLSAEERHPNIIVILADDLGYGDLSSFGASQISTPNLDRLAVDGLQLTQFYAAAPACTPSRAGLLTGRLPSRMGIKEVFTHDSPDGMSPWEITLAEQLGEAGYRTGLVGKWHLGHRDTFMPWNQGFEEFYGVPYSNDMKNFFFYENRKMILESIDQRFLTKRYTELALDYIRRHQDEKFFLYLAHSMPHVPLYVSPDFEGSSTQGLYGDVVQELDWSVGQVVEQLRTLGLLANTLLVFTSDNGPWLTMGAHGGSAGSFRDGKRSTFEGGIRVPAIIHWPAGISEPREEGSAVSMLDFFPTFSKLAELALPADRAIDGLDVSYLFNRRGESESRRFHFAEAAGSQVTAVRDGKWKLKLPREGYPKIFEPILHLDGYAHGMLLFDLEADPGEENNLASENPERIELMESMILDIEARIHTEDNPRPLLMTSASSDSKGIGGFLLKISLMAVLTIALVIYGIFRIWRFCKNAIRSQP